MPVGLEEVRTIMCLARSTTPNAAGQSGWSDTILVGAAVGLIIGTRS